MQRYIYLRLCLCVLLNMFTLSSNISNRASGVVRTSTSRGRLWFSSSHAVRSGAFFNLGGLCASREAQYLSRERGIPRTEYSANIHLIRSSEVDPFAPAPGSTRTAAARAAARAQAEAHSQRASGASSAKFVADHAAHVGPVGLAGLAAQLQAVRDELAETKRALRGVQTKGENSETSMASHLLSTAIILTVIYFIGKDVSKRVTGPPRPADGLIQAQSVTDQVDEAKAQRQRDAPFEEQVLAESGLTTFGNQPGTPESPSRSVLSGLFWARS